MTKAEIRQGVTIEWKGVRGSVLSSPFLRDKKWRARVLLSDGRDGVVPVVELKRVVTK